MTTKFSGSIRVLVLLLSLAGAASAAPSPGASNDPPQVLPKMKVSAEVPLVKVAEYQMRESRYAPAAVAHNGFIYVIGGLITAGTASDSIERFDVHTGKSEIIAHLHTARWWHRAVIVGEKIFVLGGVKPGGLASGYLEAVAQAAAANRRTNSIVLPPNPEGGFDFLSSVEIIDLATGKVSRGPEMPEPRQQFSCVQAEGQIYAIGGRREYRNKLSYTNTVEILDLAKNQWRQGVPMPTLRSTDGAVVDGGFIIMPGGYNGSFATDAVDVFDLHAGTWRTIEPLCRSTSAHSAVFLGKYLFLFGDYNSPERLLAYNLKTRESETFTLRYTPARHTAAVVADGKIYVVGGIEDMRGEPLRLIQVFEPTKSAKPQAE